MYDGNSLCDGTWALIPSQIIFLISPTVQCQFHSSVCSELWNIILHFQLNPAEIRAGSAPLPVSVIPRVRVVMETCWEGGNFWWNLPSHQWCSSLCTSELPWISAMPAENLHFRLEDSFLTAKLLTENFVLETAERLYSSWYWAPWYLVILANLSGTLTWSVITCSPTPPPPSPPPPHRLQTTDFPLIFPLRIHSGKSWSKAVKYSQYSVFIIDSRLVQSNKHRNESLP